MKYLSLQDSSNKHVNWIHKYNFLSKYSIPSGVIVSKFLISDKSCVEYQPIYFLGFQSSTSIEFSTKFEKVFDIINFFCIFKQLNKAILSNVPIPYNLCKRFNHGIYYFEITILSQAVKGSCIGKLIKDTQFADNLSKELV